MVSDFHVLALSISITPAVEVFITSVVLVAVTVPTPLPMCICDDAPVSVRAAPRVSAGLLAPSMLKSPKQVTESPANVNAPLLVVYFVNEWHDKLSLVDSVAVDIVES
jgi:hypothetical protein